MRCLSVEAYAIQRERIGTLLHRPAAHSQHEISMKSAVALCTVSAAGSVVASKQGRVIKREIRVSTTELHT